MIRPVTLLHILVTVALISIIGFTPSNKPAIAAPLPTQPLTVLPSPVLDPTPQNFREIAVGSNHSCALTSSNGIKCWGSNNNGQLGDGSLTDHYTPGNVLGFNNDVSAIATGNSHTCVLTSNGGVKCWGDNSNGQLGDGTTTRRILPIDVLGLTSGVKTIAAGSNRTCAVTNADAVKCWGANTTTPTDVVGLSSDIKMVAIGDNHACALTTTGGVKCWGNNASGQLGDGSLTARAAPTDTIGLSSGVNKITAGGNHTCALITGSVKCWGDNSAGQLGDGSLTARAIPTDTIGLSSGVDEITAGGNHTCALITGSVKCWGANNHGELGDGAVANRPTPTEVVGLSSGVSTFAAGALHTCAVLSNSGAKCWGWNDAGQLGNGSADGSGGAAAPVDVTGLSSGVSAIAVGNSHACAATSSGVKCWGDNSGGQLGDGSTTTQRTPIEVMGLSSGVSAIVAGEAYTCAVISGGVKCWGRNTHGQLGDGTTGNRVVPVDVVGLNSGTSTLAAGESHTCAVINGGAVKCWGDNSVGELGDGSFTDRSTPVDVIGLSSGVSTIAAGNAHTCVLTISGGVKCWGRNSNGQLGDGSVTNRRMATDVVGLSSGVKAIAADMLHTCALTSSGGVKCWGYNSYGQLGDGSVTDRLTPVDVVGLSSGVIAIAVGYVHTCALTSSGGVKCWGNNRYGQLGDSLYSTPQMAMDVTGLSSGVSAIAAGGGNYLALAGGGLTCALTSSEGVKCWGENEFGQVGSDAYWRTIPVDVGDPCHKLTVLHSGSGVDPVPINWSYCGANQYTQGQVASLSATPSDGWQVTGWTGTISDTSIATQNSLIMPSSDYTVSVVYEQSLIAQFSSADYTVNENEPSGKATLTVTLTRSSAVPVTVNYATSDGTATADNDYTAISGTLTFDAGAISKTFDIPIINDNLHEADETIIVTLSSPTGKVSLGSPVQATLTIQDDDPEPIPCHTMTLSHTGSGSDPIAMPANSNGCPRGQYVNGEAISFSVSPAADWQVTGWRGTTNDASTALTNTLTMPATPQQVKVIYSPIPTPTVAPWVVLIYLNGDNDLNEWTFKLFNQLELAVYHDRSLLIRVLWDQDNKNDTVLYQVQPNDDPSVLANYSEGNTKWAKGELDMGEPKTLRDFIVANRQALPADHYLLAIVDHGGGWSPELPDPQKASSRYHAGASGFSWDVTNSYHYLSTHDMGSVFADPTLQAHPLDIVFYDACLMAMVEEAYEIHNGARFFLASQYETWTSWPYASYLQGIQSRTPQAQVHWMVDQYNDSLIGYNLPHTMSAIDLQYTTAISKEINNLALALDQNLSTKKPLILNAFLKAQKLDYDFDLALRNTEGYVDLGNFAKQLIETLPGTTVQTAAQSVLDVLQGSNGPYIYYERHEDGDVYAYSHVDKASALVNLQGITGISIYLPLGENDPELPFYRADQIALVQATAWGDFILDFKQILKSQALDVNLSGGRGNKPEPVAPRHTIYLPLLAKQ